MVEEMKRGRNAIGGNVHANTFRSSRRRFMTAFAIEVLPEPERPHSNNPGTIENEALGTKVFSNTHIDLPWT